MSINRKKAILFIFLFLIIFIILFSFIAPNYTPNSPFATDFENVLKPPNDIYPFGTDNIGRCIYSRVIYGSKISISITFILLSLVSIIGVTLGVVAGMLGGKVDRFIMRTTDVILSFPDMIFVIAVLGLFGPGLRNMIIALSSIWWTKYARLTRALVKEQKDKDYVLMAKLVGVKKVMLVFKYIMPNIISQILVQVSIDIGHMMLSIAGLSFLGLGVQEPTPEWGNMLNVGRGYLQTHPWLLYYPGLAIFIVVAVFNIFGDVLRDLLDPKYN